LQRQYSKDETAYTITTATSEKTLHNKGTSIRYQLWRSSEEVEGKPMILLVDQKKAMEMVGRIEHALEYVVLGGVEDANGAGGELRGWSALDQTSKLQTK